LFLIVPGLNVTHLLMVKTPSLIITMGIE